MTAAVHLPKMDLYGLPYSLLASLNVQANPGLLLRRLEDARPITVVVPVYNGGAAVLECLDSLLMHGRGLNVIVIDDASTSPEIIELLDERSVRGDFTLERHSQNWGYTRTVNQGVMLAQQDDVILLNSDTVVGPLWATRLQWVAYSRYDVATATAASDNAGAMSVPQPGKYNHWQQHLSWTEVARAVAQSPVGWDSVIPTGHGFCMYIRRAAFDRIGYFDVDAFPSGYGEENDFSQRAIMAGMTNLFARHVIVKHERSQSFGASRRNELIADGIKVLTARYPSYGEDVSHWLNAKVTKRQQNALSNIQTQLQSCVRVLPRRLYIIHRSVGGTVETNADLMEALVSEQESLVFDSTGNGELGLHLWRGSKAVLLQTWKLKQGFGEADEWRADYADVLVRILVGLAIETVHVRHLFQHPMATTAKVLDLLRIPRILSTHDFFYISPSITLLDERSGIKPGISIPGVGNHLVAHTRKKNSVPMTPEWLAYWQKVSRQVLNSFDAMVATTKSAAGIYREAYGNDLPPLSLIEHGRDFGPRWEQIRFSGRKPGPLRIAAAANWDPPKGIEYVKEMAEKLGPLVEIHILGRGSEQLGSNVVSHGPYNRDSLRPILAEIDPDIMGMFSVWPETYSHTLTESWALGIPVIATDIGAVAERIRHHGGGWLVPVDESHSAAELITDLTLSPDRVMEMRARVPRDEIRGTTTMSRDYLDLYHDVSQGLTKRPRVGYAIRDGKPASAHIRLLRRFIHPLAEKQIDFRHVSVHDIVFRSDNTDYDVLIIQRDAVPSEYTDRLVTWAKTSGTTLILELDDDLVSTHAVESLRTDPYYSQERLNGIHQIARAASLITVSTAALQSSIGQEYGEVKIVENSLDPRLWLSDRTKAVAPSDGMNRILYMGTNTHMTDFLILVPVMEQLWGSGRPIVLEVIGIGEDLPEYPWLRRIPVPQGASSYPVFVSWLRSHERRWSMAVAPLAESPINRSKSQLKLLEYSMLGLVTVASEVGPYGAADANLALKTKNSTQSWVECIVSILDNPEHTADTAGRAKSYVIENLMMNDANINEWINMIVDAQLRQAATTSRKNIAREDSYN